MNVILQVEAAKKNYSHTIQRGRRRSIQSHLELVILFAGIMVLFESVKELFVMRRIIEALRAAAYSTCPTA